MSAKDPRYYVESKQRALQIPDVKTANEVMKLLQINKAGMRLTGREDCIKVIVDELNKGINPESLRKSEPTTGLKKAIEEDRKYKSKLLSKYDRVQKLYKELPKNYQNDLNKLFQGIEENFEFRKREIQKSDCTILIAGETGAGKSSLINLMLGVKDLMPTSQLGCTATICELRSNVQGKKEAVGYFRTMDESGNRKKRPPVIIDLHKDAGIQEFQKAATDCDEDGNSPYDRIEVTWPFAMLEEGLVIVDTPGIGGGGHMAKYAEKYLSKSYGFIYVVNSANAGGIQKGRLQNFMRLVVNSADEEGFNSESTIVICNKWEMVPERDRDAVKHDTFEKLSRYFTDIKKAQIHYMSIGEAQRAARLSTDTQEYGKLLEMVERLLPDSLRSRLNVHYRWLTAVLKRTIYILKVSKVMQTKSMEKRKDKFQHLKVQIEKLEQNSKESITYLKVNISGESEMVAQRSIEVLQSRHMAEIMFDWGFGDLPRDDKKKVASEALEKIANKIATEMNVWERENTIVAGIKEKIVTVCKKDFELMEDQIAKIEGALLDGDNRIVRDLHRSLKRPAPVRQVWTKSKGKSFDEDSGTFKGLGGAIVSSSNIKTTDKQIKKIFSDYKTRDPEKCLLKMQDATKVFLDSIFQSSSLREKLHKFFSRFVKDIDAVAKMIPDFLKADFELMETLKTQLSDTEANLRGLFPRLLQECHVLLGQCDIFYVNHIFRFDYSLSDLKWDPKDRPIGKGSFADVFLAQVKTRHGVIPVALKECRDPLKESTVTDILLEDRTLRELDHPNIVRYYGATFRMENTGHNRGMHWIMIMEMCKYTLKSKFLNPESKNPGKMQPGSAQHLDAMLAMADVARQLFSGVKYLHDKGFVHRDLKLENILVTERNAIKLTDVGLTKHVSEIGHSQVGSPVYMAPEVLLMSHQNYDYKADIYSMAILLWEMWYGSDAAVYIHHQIVKTLEDSIKNGLRPSLTKPTQPPEKWANLIERSWDYNPDNRPNAEQLYKFFEDFIYQSRRM